MAAGDLIDFDIIEGQKENIQSLPGGRSAKKLVEAFSSSPLHKLSTPTPTDTKNINDCIRAEYEEEIANISESDDPLDVFDRYVRWTFDAYPSAQATPQSQLHTLLERATKSFIGSAQYKNDPRYLKLWLLYIKFFSDSPRETYVFLSRHTIGETLALFYEEYAAWLESAGRWSQAEEVYKLGIEREARPVQRLVRKFGEFEQRRAQDPAAADAPSSPALPTVRPALMAKVDPYAALARAPAPDPQAPRPNMGLGGQSSKPGKAKLAVFSDAGSEASPMSKMGESSKGWDTIGSLADRKKENMVEAKPWVGETLTTQVKKSSGPKMAVFRDPSMSRIAESHIVIAPSKHQVIVNPQSGKRERVYVNLEAIYPTPEEPGTELSFEELWAANQGWLDVCWDDDNIVEEQEELTPRKPEIDLLGHRMAEKLIIHHDAVELDENGAIKDQARPVKSKKKKMLEVNETQIIKAKLDSPSGPKIKKKSNSYSSEPTMTMHTKAATNEIYDLFNAPLKPTKEENEESGDEDYLTDGDYTSGGESANTTRQISTSEAGDDDETSDVKSVSEWSDFTAQKHVPRIEGDGNDEQEDGEQGDSVLSDLIDTKDDDDEESEDSPPRTRFIPIPPEDYEAPTRPYRDPAEVANNRLPFMTPITERTESSLGLITAAKSITNKVLSKRDSRDDLTEEEEDEDDEDFGPLSSPLREVLNENRSPLKIAQPLLKKLKAATPPSQQKAKEIQKGPIIKELRCNPVDKAVREEILERMHAPLTSYPGFYDHRSERCDKGAEVRKFAKAMAKAGGKKDGDKTGTIHSLPVLEFPEIIGEYTIKRELGAGAFAPVYLIENSSPDDDDADENTPQVAMGKGAFATSSRHTLEALKMEQPPTAWEFHMMRLAATRLGPQHRATASISAAHELHLYQDEGFLILPLHPHGTLLDVVNFFSEANKAPMDESLAMFFSIELLRTVEALHAKQILHGDLKPDNCLLRLDDPTSALASQWRADGSGGWSARGVVLIDFGRGIDMRAFDPDVQFVADWKTDLHDCAEVREGRPWTWQLDYHGLAGTIHTLLFGKYIETARADQGGLGTSAGRRYKIRESLKRYWQTEIWAECFDVLLNPGSHVEAEEGRRMPVNRSLRRVRERMEGWLEVNCEKGVGVRGLMARVEGMAKARRH
ncbi:Mad3/BUB1 homology region 1-domain-containing protein [Annulohypoxylon maeteangense]|uniref:Mad3/BUB1 homology region 1-domain-containing protein n=1 Tax=Annulohypoxylon maeteangense TaxID=1927788 RepID=UPI002008E3FD|nr:Mad3/BUB1 homology region 1-domain-containing protein [Annulohypoxylon maeteangense]KAI0889885.1 Mad3/BUB1 homology region 1-domain-containing protein [Annulohypoxylon maeteangense]